MQGYIYFSFFSIMNKNNDTVELSCVTIDVNWECHKEGGRRLVLPAASHLCLHN